MSEPPSNAMELNQMHDIHVEPDLSALTDLDNMLLAVAEEARLKNAPNPLPKWLRSRSDVHQWQQDMICMAKARCTRYLAGERQVVRALRTLLCVAVPGSGKTIGTLLWIKTAIMMGWVQRVIIVTPSDNVKKNWGKEAKNFGLDLKYKNTAEILDPLVCGHIGRCTTYQQVARLRDKPVLKEQLKAEFRQYPTMLVCDEIHHAATNSTWGTLLEDLFDEVAAAVLLSGTPVRTDGEPLPFTFPQINAEGKHEAVAHAAYTYRQGLEDGNLRALDLHTENGLIKWHTGNTDYEHYLTDDVTKTIRRKRLIKAIDLQSVDEQGTIIPNNFVRKVLFDAANELHRIRLHYPDAQGLIVCENKEAARFVQKTTFKSVTGHLQDGGIVPKISISNVGGARDESHIDEFRDNPRSFPWIVAVKQISEGVDIPNICVIVYLTNVSTRMFIIQVLGRAMRISKTPSMKRLRRCWVFIPKDDRLVGQCQTLLNDVSAYRDSIVAADESASPAEIVSADESASPVEEVPVLAACGNVIDTLATAANNSEVETSGSSPQYEPDHAAEPDVLDPQTTHTQTVQFTTDDDLLRGRQLEGEDGVLVPGLADIARQLQALPGCSGVDLGELMALVRRSTTDPAPRLNAPASLQTLTLDEQLHKLRNTVRKKVNYLVRVSEGSPRRWTRQTIYTQLSWNLFGMGRYKPTKEWSLAQLEAATERYIPCLATKIKAGGRLDMR